MEPGDRLLEPAERAGREAAEDHPRLPCLAEDLVDSVRSPDPEQADDAPAAHVDQVLSEKVRAQILGPLLAAKERDVAGNGSAAAEGPVEADDVVVGIPGGRGKEADAGRIGAGQGST